MQSRAPIRINKSRCPSAQRLGSRPWKDSEKVGQGQVLQPWQVLAAMQWSSDFLQKVREHDALASSDCHKDRLRATPHVAQSPSGSSGLEVR